MGIEKIVCPICKAEMKRGKVSALLELAIQQDDNLPAKIPVNFFACMTCHNIQLFVESSPDESELV